MPKPRLHDLSREELQAVLVREPAFRTEQIWHAVYRELAEDYQDISTLPLDLRRCLADRLPPTIAVPEVTTRSADGKTEKTLFRLDDGESIESVLLRYPDRSTVCVSSQVGCAIGCPFCATGSMGFVRDLRVGEIVVQALHAARTLQEEGRRLSHLVYMGMGEPLLNLDHVLQSVRILNDGDGFGLGARAFTISTAGVVPGIDRLSTERIQLNLAVSLHAGENALRDRLVPLNRQYPVDALLDACWRYVERTNRRVTFEVALMAGVNDRRRDAEALARLLAGHLCHVNLIPCNPSPASSLAASPPSTLSAFADHLSRRAIPVTVRTSKGGDIEAGCGQLRARVREERGDG